MHLNVAAAMIVNDAGAVLCVRRGASKFASTAHRWEFPGGKIEPGETPAQAAVREIREELGMDIRPLADGPTVEHAYPEFSISLHGVLSRFAQAGLNLTKIESRPILGRRFEYDFYLDFTGSVRDEKTLALLASLSAELPRFSFLGNYTERE